jgi:fluoride exporter
VLYFLIALGSAFGGICRYWLSTHVHALAGKDFPYGTLAVNVIGAFLVGFIFILLLNRFGDISDALRALIIIGFLGGFTTFSAFSLETMHLIEVNEILRASFNIFLSIFLCLGSTFMGMLLGRQF